jgi:hypothetical protein
MNTSRSHNSPPFQSVALQINSYSIPVLNAKYWHHDGADYRGYQEEESISEETKPSHQYIDLSTKYATHPFTSHPNDRRIHIHLCPLLLNQAE